MPKKRKPVKMPSSVIRVCIYGIWSKIDNRIINVSLEQEDVEMEFDMEGYNDDTHSIVSLDTFYDISGMGS